jgi:hypothetical protein
MKSTWWVICAGFFFMAVVCSVETYRFRQNKEAIDPNSFSDRTIRLLCSSGRICEVMGHQWRLQTFGGPYVGQERCDLCWKIRSP